MKTPSIVNFLCSSRKLLFFLFGFMAVLTENGIVIALIHYGFNFIESRIVGTIITVVFSYTLNTIYTFNANHSKKRFAKYIVGVGLSAFVSFVVSLFAFYFLFNKMHPLIAVNIGAGVAAIINYLFQDRITYKE